MDYTREPIIETVITPKEGCKLVLRNTKGASQEEYFVDAVEVVTFGTTHFFRSLEKPKPFLIPTTDFEVLEVREPRLILKTSGIDRSIKISGGREKPHKEHAPKESHREHKEPVEDKKHDEKGHEEKKGEEKRTDQKRSDEKDATQGERKRNRRSSRRRRDRDEDQEVKGDNLSEAPVEPPPVPRLISPPPTLISETLSRYREQDQFKGAFYDKEEEHRHEASPEAERPFFSATEEFSEEDDLLFRTTPQEPSSEGSRVKRHRPPREEVQQIEEDPFDNPPLIDED